MKRKVKKLKLDKETLRNLESSQLEQVIGAATELDTCARTCWNTCGRTCHCVP